MTSRSFFPFFTLKRSYFQRLFILHGLAALPPIILAGFLSREASAALLFEESFNYQAGQSISGANGGTGFPPNNAWQQLSSDVITTEGLSFPGLSVSGNALLSTPLVDKDSSQSIRSFDAIAMSSGSTYWFSFLMRLDSIPEGSSVSDFTGYVALMPAISGKALKIGILQGSLNVSIGSNTPGLQSASSPGTITIGQTYFVVVRIDSGNLVTLYLNPTPGVENPPGAYQTVSQSLTLATEFTRVGVFSEHIGANWTFDELRLGTTYLDVAPIPEPSEWALIFSGAAALFFLKVRSRVDF